MTPVMLAEVSLDDKYTRDSGRIFLTGIQALVRLPMLQRRRDLAAGHDTAGYVTGYRGSPLGGLDQQLAAARRFLEEHHVLARPAVNEDLAATALWGTQQAGLHGEGRYDGVFGMWYGKGPGVDRTGDVFKHGNLAGTAPLGGVLVLMGDDHTCESSTTAHQSEFALVDAMIPVLNPAGVAEILAFGLLGFELSRYSGCWIGLKSIHDTVNTAATIELEPALLPIRAPDFELPPGGLNIRWPDAPLAQEERLHRFKLDAVRAFARANRFDRLVFDSPHARLGIVSTGKSYLDLRQALDDLGIDQAQAARLGLRVLKLGLVWPLEPSSLLAFADGLEQIVVVEEKRPLIESQLKELLYGRASAPRVVGKRDEEGRPLFPSHGALSSNRIAAALALRILKLDAGDLVAAQLERLRQRESAESRAPAPMLRTPYFCSGCPHNTSTRVPEGSIAKAGIGCHYMAQWMDRSTAGYTQMGGEGANWVGEAPFSKRPHVFQNIGDGTYYHSGLLAVRASIAAGVNITFKILYNDAVAMTGGQRVDGPLSVPQITREVWAEGAQQVVVVTDEPDKYPINAGFAPGVTVRPRAELDAVQRELREIEGTTVLVYDQTCAAEKRRRRKRGQMADPPKRVVINEVVCEGCGDCGLASNCVSIVPVETEFGRKRQIDQSSCNKDYSCLEGFCPSFVTVEGAEVRRAPAGHGDDDALLEDLPEPALPALSGSYGIAIGGVGGTGVVTIGALLGMAAHLEGKGAAVLDMTGLAQKGGAVMSHLRIAPRPEDIQTVRIAPGGAQLLLGCDLVVAGGNEALAALEPATGHAVVNTQAVMTGDFTRAADLEFPAAALERAIVKAAGERATFVDATRLATALLGDAIATNLFMVGVAYQRGLLPVSAAAIERAIELNRVAADMNRRAFRWGRNAVLDPAALEAAATPPVAPADHRRRSASLEEAIARRVAFLKDYQDAAYAEGYRRLVERVRAVESSHAPGRGELAEAVARYWFKLLAYKDEYEVARLYTDGAFRTQLERQFAGQPRLQIHLAPPFFAARDPATGQLRKKAYGPWMLRAMVLLARGKRLRGTAFDPFGRSAERRTERRLIADYRALVEELLAGLTLENHALAVEIARIPEQIRGYGHVKQRHLDAAKRREVELLALFRAPATRLSAAE